MHQVGSAVIHPTKQRVWRISRILGLGAWIRPMTGTPIEEGPFPLAELRSDVSAPMRLTF